MLHKKDIDKKDVLKFKSQLKTMSHCKIEIHLIDTKYIVKLQIYSTVYI